MLGYLPGHDDACGTVSWHDTLIPQVFDIAHG